MDIKKLIHTIKYLKFVQVYYRLHYILLKPKVQKKEFSLNLREVKKKWNNFIEKPISMIGEKEFYFLNKKGKLSSILDWNAKEQDKLWLYNLHYFDDLNAKGALERQVWHYNLIDQWIEQNPYALGNAWEPYPTSLRIVNWVKWALSGNKLNTIQLQSLALQAAHLYKNIEWHILANHLFANAKALIFAGLFFDSDESNTWLQKGLRIYQKEIQEQVLADGGNFELTPMYHSIFLEDLLDIYQLQSIYSVNETLDTIYLSSIIKKMLVWLSHMCHPDGDISFFNDSTLGIAPTFKSLKSYAISLNILYDSEIVEACDAYLKDSGYISICGDDYKMIVDVAKVGPDYQPGHAHADTLSFELSIGKERLFVNSGISQYGLDKERNRQRSTSAHNTVIINNIDSSEVWAGFRVARRAYPKLEKLEFNDNDKIINFKASHNGYRNLGLNVYHQRSFEFKDQQLIISDFIIGSYVTAEARFHLHPSVKVISIDDHSLQFELDKYKCEIRFSKGSVLNFVKTTWQPEFGKIIENQCISVNILNGTLVTTISWSRK